jgi:hypothetical protein
VPILQIINLLFGIFVFLLEYPVKPLAGTAFHSSIEMRLFLFPLLALAAIIMYQTTNAAIYYVIGEIIYFWAFYDGEVSYHIHACCFVQLLTIEQTVCEKPWQLPKRQAPKMV